MLPKQIFDRAFERVVGHEGGFQNMHDDRGNWTTGIVGEGELKGTKYGVSAMSYPKHDIENLTLEQAKVIYYSRYWLPLKPAVFSPAMQYQMFDAAVNHGIRNAVKMLQKAIGANDDGYVGAKTIVRMATVSPTQLPMLFNAERIAFYTKINTFDLYGKGWVNRVSENLKFAAEDSE